MNKVILFSIFKTHKHTRESRRYDDVYIHNALILFDSILYQDTLSVKKQRIKACSATLPLGSQVNIDFSGIMHLLARRSPLW